MTPTNRPQVDCTSRLTISSSCSCAPPARCASCSSKPMAPSTLGSPKSLAKMKTSKPAARPQRMPRIRNFVAMSDPSVAGEAEHVPAVMHEFVHPGAGDKRSSPLLRADEVERDQCQKTGEDDPRQQLAEREGLRQRLWRQSDIGHHVSLGFRVPLKFRDAVAGSD